MLAWVKSLSGTSMLVEDFATFIEPLKLPFHDNHCSGWFLCYLQKQIVGSLEDCTAKNIDLF